VAQRFAVADLGSNSFRLVVYAWGDGRWRRIDEIFEAVRIGAGEDRTGALSEEAIARALATIDVFAHFVAASGLSPSEVAFVATSAIREASNRDAFLERARAVAGTAVRVLEGDEEARYGYLAAVNSTTLADGVVLDLGGGSMQLVRVAGRLEADAASWPLGAVRMTERFFGDDAPATRKQLDKLRAHVAAELESAGWLAASRRLVAIGGTARTLAAADQRAQELPSFGVGGHVIEAAALDELIERLAELPPSERASIPGIKPARADVILAGAVVVRGAMEASGVDGVEVTEAGLREGMFFERLIDADPPLLEDVRQESVYNLAAQYDIDVPHARHVAELATTLFDELAASGLHDGDPIERELLWAACLLHDIGMAVNYDDHHKHTRYLILNGGLPGFTPREVALIAQATRYHRKGMPTFGELAPLMTAKGDAALLDRAALLLRLAEDLERSRDQSVRSAHAEVEDGEVRLQLVADGDVRVARWAASREQQLFERAFDRTLDVGR